MFVLLLAGNFSATEGTVLSRESLSNTTGSIGGNQRMLLMNTCEPHHLARRPVFTVLSLVVFLGLRLAL